jgi:AhpD family alkylhydroperoxidase
VPDRVLHDILRGGIDKMAEAGVSVIGGHSIKDAEIKAGFAVTGVIDPKRLTLRAGARPGDVLVLTKPLGTGIVAFASQIDRAPPEAVEAAARSMTALNKTASELMLACSAHGCTDITGFGLMGHLAEMAAGGRVDVEIVWDDLPLLPGVLDLVGQGVIPGGVERNRESSGAAATLGKGVQPAMLEVCLDAQTSGGLLIALSPRNARTLLARLHAAGITEAAIIGKVRGRGRGRVFLTTRGERPIIETRSAVPAPDLSRGPNLEEPDMSKKTKAEQPACCGPALSGGRPALSGGRPAPAETSPCCSEGHGEAAVAAPAGVRGQFVEFLKAASAPGALDAHTKQAIAVALSVLARCDPCIRNHVRRARQMGFSQDEIDEAALMGIAFGGASVMMFYDAIRAEEARASADAGPSASGGGCCDKA